MFKIDLLKGQGIPEKTRPEGVLIGVLAFAAPVVVAMVLLSLYLTDKAAIAADRRQLASYDTQIARLADAVDFKRTMDQRRQSISQVLAEVASAIDRYTQWTDVLVAVVRNMPDSMVLTALEVKKTTIKKRVPKKDNPEASVNVSVPIRTLRITVSGRSEDDCDVAVRDFSERLRRCDALSSKLQDIRVARHNLDRYQKDNLVSYEIDCVFKPPL